MATVSNELRIQRWLYRIIGLMVLTTVLLGYFHSRYWLFATMFIGLNLLQFSFTDWCPLEIMLKKRMKS